MTEYTILETQALMSAGDLGAVDLVQHCLQRIAEIDRAGPCLNAVSEINPEAMAIASALDEERRAHGPRGPLHGIAILLKENIGTPDRMMTTAGSLALLGSIAPHDATVAARLRQAGAVILGKSNLSEWANFRSTRSVSGWSSRSGQTRNPYALDRNPSGSSSGSAVAVAASLCSAAVGTETDGSIISPAQTCGIVGIKPTLGLVSRAGIIPIAHSQDTAGPLARTVGDAAILLAALAGPDPCDPAADACAAHGAAILHAVEELWPGAGADSPPAARRDHDRLEGVRIGVARSLFGFNDRVDRIMEDSIAALRDLGAQIVDPADIGDIATAKQLDESEMQVLLYEFKAGLNAYLAGLGPAAPVHTLQEIIEFNERRRDRVMPYFGQELMIMAEAKGPLTDEAYLAARATCVRLARTEGIDATLRAHSLDAIIAPSGGPAWLTDYVNGDHYSGGSSSAAAVSGCPSITVPAGSVHGLPVGISFIGAAWSEPALIRYAALFERATQARRPPAYLPSIRLA